MAAENNQLLDKDLVEIPVLSQVLNSVTLLVTPGPATYPANNPQSAEQLLPLYTKEAQPTTTLLESVVGRETRSIKYCCQTRGSNLRSPDYQSNNPASRCSYIANLLGISTMVFNSLHAG